MGAIIAKRKKPIHAMTTELLDNTGQDKYDEDVHDAANLAIAIQKEDYTTTLELFISCKDLPKMDAFSLSDPMVIVYMEQDGNTIKLGRTECIQDTVNPKFAKTFVVAYNPEKKQTLKFDVWDIDDFKDIDNLAKQDPIGLAEVSLHEIVLSPGQSTTRPIVSKKKRKKNSGEVTVRASEYEQGTSKINFYVSAKGFRAKGEISFRASAMDSKRQVFPFYLSEPKQAVKKSLEWNAFSVNANRVYDDATSIKFEVFEVAKNGQTSPIGEMENILSVFLIQSGKYYKVMKNGMIMGELLVEARKIPRHSFLSYVFGGAQISLMMCVDFTNSNRDMRDRNSLHYFDDERSEESEYAKAIRTVGGILQYYDHDNRYPLYGFGAKLPPYQNVVSHCFAMNGNFFDPEVYTLDEVIQTYKETVGSFKFHGPSIFAEIVKMGAELASSSEVTSENQKYYVVVIFTDGNINDVDNTIAELVKASYLPISFIIVGLGDEEFSTVKMLDPGDDLLFSKNLNMQAKRSITHFVPFRKFCNDQKAIAREVLAKLPKQFLKYFKDKGVEPNSTGKARKITNQEFIQQRNRPLEKKIPEILIQKKEQFYNKLLKLEFDPAVVKQIIDGLPAPDVNLVIEIANMNQKNKQSEINIVEIPLEGDVSANRSRPENDEAMKKKIKKREYIIDSQKLFEAEERAKRSKHYLEATRVLIENKDKYILQAKKEVLGEINIEKINPKVKQNPKWKVTSTAAVTKLGENQNEHFKLLTANTMQVSTDVDYCLACGKNIIDCVLMPCGHAASCHQCLEAGKMKCLICNATITNYIFSNPLDPNA